MASSDHQIMVFRPTMEEMKDFEKYILYMESQGAHHTGICKVIPPKEYCPRRNGYDDLNVVIPSPIMQVVNGRLGMFQQINIQKKSMTVQEFQKLAESDRYKTPTNFGYEDLERRYWRNIAYNSPIYGADVSGSLYDKDFNIWNINSLNTILDLVDEDYGIKIEGVNTAYLYFGMWKTTFAWHTEDMNLYSINYLHFGAPKSWYVIPPEHGKRLERLAAGFFPSDSTTCPAFLRHKMTIISPHTLKKYSIPVHKITQEEGEFMITFPYAYHSGFNHGFNCAESTNFGMERWIEYGKRASQCTCRNDMVKINMDTFVKRYQSDRYKLWIDGRDSGPNPEEPNKVSIAPPPRKYVPPVGEVVQCRSMKGRVIDDDSGPTVSKRHPISVMKRKRSDSGNNSQKHFKTKDEDSLYSDSECTLTDDEEGKVCSPMKEFDLNTVGGYFTTKPEPPPDYTPSLEVLNIADALADSLKSPGSGLDWSSSKPVKKAAVNVRRKSASKKNDDKLRIDIVNKLKVIVKVNQEKAKLPVSAPITLEPRKYGYNALHNALYNMMHVSNNHLNINKVPAVKSEPKIYSPAISSSSAATQQNNTILGRLLATPKSSPSSTDSPSTSTFITIKSPSSQRGDNYLNPQDVHVVGAGSNLIQATKQPQRLIITLPNNLFSSPSNAQVIQIPVSQKSGDDCGLNILSSLSAERNYINDRPRIAIQGLQTANLQSLMALSTSRKQEVKDEVASNELSVATYEEATEPTVKTEDNAKCIVEYLPTYDMNALTKNRDMEYVNGDGYANSFSTNEASFGDLEPVQETSSNMLSTQEAVSPSHDKSITMSSLKDLSYPRHSPSGANNTSDEDSMSSSNDDSSDLRGWIATMSQSKPFSLQDEIAFNMFMSDQPLHCAICSLFSPLQVGDSEEAKNLPEKSKVYTLPHLFWIQYRNNNPVLHQDAFSGPSNTPDGKSTLLVCSQCKVCVHASCYGVSEEHLSQWLCTRCAKTTSQADCCLCHMRGGALKPTIDNRWVHVICALFIAEVDFQNPAARESIDVSKVTQTRNKLRCFFCGVTGGCVQCSFGKCPVAFHVSCGLFGGVEYRSCNWPNLTLMTCSRHLYKKKLVHTTLPDIKTGDTVIAKHRNNRYYRSKVVEVHTSRLYTVEFLQDHSFSENIQPEDIKSMDCVKDGPPDPGTTVTVIWNDGKVYDAIFKSHKTLTKCKVEFEDNFGKVFMREEIYALDEKIPKAVLTKLSSATEMQHVNVFYGGGKVEGKRQRIQNTKYN